MSRLGRFALSAMVGAAASVSMAVMAAPALADSVLLHMLISPDEGNTVATWTQKFKEETGITVQSDFVSWADMHNKSVTALAGGGGGYDLFFVPSADAVNLMAGGYFEPLNDMMSESDKKNWLPSVTNLYTVNGQLLAMPWYAGGAHMAYNKKILQAAGVDPDSIKTWDDFMAACAKIKETKAARFCFAPSAKYRGEFDYFWGSMHASRGGKLFDASGSPIFQNDGQALAVNKMVQEGISKGYFDPAGVAMDDYETLVQYGNGNEAFLLNSTWSVTQANTNKDLSKILGDSGLILIPGTDAIRSGGYLYAGAIGILKTSTHKEEAKKFLSYFTDTAPQKQHAIDGANMPTRVALYQDPDIAAAWKGFTMLGEQLKYGVFSPPVPWFDEWQHSLASSLQDMINGNKTPEQQIQFMVDETKRIKSE